MSRIPRWMLCALCAISLQPLAGCADSAAMTPQQKEAYELRRYCERTHDAEKCVGYMGFL